MSPQDLELVLAIQERGSLSAAGEALGLAAPVATKRLAALEARLGHRLFQRSTRRIAATAEGLLVCTRAHALLEGFRGLEAELRERRHELSGPLRIASTFGFGRLWLGPALADFQLEHPGVDIRLDLRETLPDLSAEGFDAAIWLWRAPRSHSAHWSVRRLAANRRVLVASPAYLARRGAPDTPEDLVHHDCLRVHENAQRADTWTLQREGERQRVAVRVQGPLASNSGELARDWCVDGRGILLRSLWDVAPLVREGRLVHLLPAWTMGDADIQWLAPWQAQPARRLRLLADHLARRFRAAPWLQAESPRVKAGARAPRG